MILEKLSSFDKYEPVVKGLRKAVELAESSREMKPGKYEIDGYIVLVQEGETSHVSIGEFEAHKKFTDLQYVAEGSEVMVWAKTNDLEMTVPYDEATDKALYKGEGTPIEVKSGQFYAMFPDDAHKACCHINEKTKFKKIVIKCPA